MDARHSIDNSRCMVWCAMDIHVTTCQWTSKASKPKQNMHVEQWRIQTFWHGGTIYQSRRHLSQMHTTNYRVAH